MRRGSEGVDYCNGRVVAGINMGGGFKVKKMVCCVIGKRWWWVSNCNLFRLIWANKETEFLD